MLFCLCKSHRIPQKLDVDVLSWRMLHSVSVLGTNKFLLTALSTIDLNFLWCFIQEHQDRGRISHNFCGIRKFISVC